MQNNTSSTTRQTLYNSHSNKYHTVSIRNDLPKIPKSYKEEPLRQFPPKDFWLKKLDPSYIERKSSTDKRYEIQYTMVNESYTSDGGNHPILTAFLRAYNSHEDIILSPDDIWLMICIYFAKYVNNNMEKLQHLYINDQHKKVLTIEDEQIMEPNWEDFLNKIRLQMTNHIKNNICTLFTNNFSTTTKIEYFLSSLAMMSIFKKCFNYTYDITSCGIRNIHFLGTLNDWILLYEKTEQLRSITIDKDDFSLYIDGILPILDQFIQTYQGNVNNQFWDTIFDLKHVNDESNQSDEICINGWFLKLCYGNHNKKTCCVTYIELNPLIVPVILENEHTNTSKICYLAGGFHGIQSYNGTHKPISNLTIIDDITSVTILEK